MKAKGLLFTLLASSMVLGACSAEVTEAVKADDEVSQTATSETVAKEESKQGEKKETSKGKRSNPFIIGNDEVASMASKYYSNDGETIEYTATYQFSNPVDGEEAWEYVQAQNPYNEPAPDGWQWVILDLTFQLVEGGEDESFMPYINPSSVKSDGTPSPDGYVTFDGDDFGFPEVYHGGTATGKVATLFPVDDEDATIKVSPDGFTDIFFKFK